MEDQIQPNIPPASLLPQVPTPIPTSTNWLKIVLLIVLGLIVITGSIFVGIQIGKNQTTNQRPITVKQIVSPTLVIVEPTILPTETNSADTNQGIKFTGIITETNNGCWSDGICSIKVDDKWITAEIGGLRAPNSKPEIRGSLIGINFTQDTNKYIGKRAEVYAKQTDGNNFTIYGNESYYIKLLE